MKTFFPDYYRRLETRHINCEAPRAYFIPYGTEAEALEGGEVRARTAFLVYRSHLETDHQILSGYRDDLLRRTDMGWKIARRTIVLDANVLLDKNLSVFL